MKKTLSLLLAALLVLILTGFGVVYWFIQNKFSKMNIVTLPEDTYAYTEATAEETLPTETQPMRTEETTAETTIETTRPPMSADDIINILVVGQAARDGESGKALSHAVPAGADGGAAEGLAPRREPGGGGGRALPAPLPGPDGAGGRKDRIHPLPPGGGRHPGLR